jgi:hypothetical protein
MTSTQVWTAPVVATSSSSPRDPASSRSVAALHMDRNRGDRGDENRYRQNMSSSVRYAVRNLNDMVAVDELIRASRSWTADRPVVLDMSRVRTTWPNTTVSFAATLDHLRTKRGLTIEVDGLRIPQAHTRLAAPDAIRTLRRGAHPTNIVWEYRDESEAQTIADHFMASLTDLVACQSGVIDTFNWCIYEVLDNVFQHSHATNGFVMMQVHTNRRLCVIAVTDSGRGIHRAMVEASHGSSVDPTRVKRADFAIQHALEQGVTSKGKLNQGNGLHGLRRAVAINGGQLSVRSGRGAWNYQDGKEKAEFDGFRPLLDSDTSHSTTVDWRLNCAQPVSINEALGRPEQPSGLLEKIEITEGFYLINASELQNLVGSRTHGTEVRTRIQNFLSAGAKQVVLDLSGIPLVSSSFADEVLGKLALEMGELEYRRRIFLESASVVNRGLIERAIELRLAGGM